MSSIKKELVLNRSESAEASVEELSKQLQQQSEEYTEAKSCAEFGYEGVYLD
jgi:hypothetical protein